MLLKSGLYIVSTPIGNLDDITIRALNVLKHSTIIFCEDTRVSKKLLLKHNITEPKLQVYNDYSDEKDRDLICSLIDRGEVISLVSDAGTPLISDPGYKLIKTLKSRGYFIEVIPGVSSPIAALTLSCLPSDRFLFLGFLPKTIIAQHKIFAELSNIKASLIFFDSAKRVLQSLKTAKDVLGNREACVARELTKLYQEARTDNLEELIKYYDTNPPKGEIILLISGRDVENSTHNIQENLEKLLKLYLSKGLTAKNATSLAYEQFKNSCSKQEIYSLANKIKK